MDAEELLKKIRELEEGQSELKREVSELLGHHDDSSSRRRPKQPFAAPTSSRTPHADLTVRLGGRSPRCS